MIDLHIHTTASDGSYTPAQIVEMAKDNNVKAIAITDHDTIGAFEEEIPWDKGVEIIKGVEFSANLERGTLHILGYFIDTNNSVLREKLEYLKKCRNERNPLIIKKLNEHGVPIEYDEVKKIAGSDVVGRAHIARVLVQKGVVKDVDEAFEKFLKKGACCYVGKVKFDARMCIELVHQAGGVAVLAHPFTLEMEEDKLYKFVKNLKDMGLDGIEIFYPDHTFHQMLLYLKLAREFNLIITGGTDFHGFAKPNIQIGVGYNNMCVPYEILEVLKEKKR